MYSILSLYLLPKSSYRCDMRMLGLIRTATSSLDIRELKMTLKEGKTKVRTSEREALTCHRTPRITYQSVYPCAPAIRLAAALRGRAKDGRKARNV